VASCCERGDELSVSCATELVKKRRFKIGPFDVRLQQDDLTVSGRSVQAC
jgi:hypothetical protein